MKGVISRFRSDEDSGRDGLDEEELAGVVVHLHDYLELPFGDIAACMPRSHDELREYYEDHPMAGEVEPKDWEVAPRE